MKTVVRMYAGPDFGSCFDTGISTGVGVLVNPQNEHPILKNLQTVGYVLSVANLLPFLVPISGVSSTYCGQGLDKKGSNFDSRLCTTDFLKHIWSCWNRIRDILRNLFSDAFPRRAKPGCIRAHLLRCGVPFKRITAGLAQVQGTRLVRFGAGWQAGFLRC